ncbi:hypothetical protein HQ531_07635, partial [bacterium]|nr:hypothetical protein [bacterium]
GDTLIESLEGGIGNSADAINTISIIPVSSAAANIGAAGTNITHKGDGKSNFLLDANPVSDSQLSDYSYELTFSYVQRNEIGNPGVVAVPIITDSSRVPNIHYGFEFTSANTFTFHNLSTQEILYPNAPFYYGSVYEYTLVPDAFYMGFEPADTVNIRSVGDYISLNFCAQLDRYNSEDTLQVMSPQPFDPGMELVSDDGLIIVMRAQAELQDISIPPILNFNINFEVEDSDSLLDTSYQIIITSSATDSEGLAYITASIAYSDLTMVNPNDTLYNGSSSHFNGIIATYTFDPANPPPIGTTATLTSLPEISPTIQDSYTFGIASGSTDQTQLESALDAIRVVPNPYMVGSLWEQDFGSLRKEPLRQIQFTNLPTECDIYIFSLAGNLIKSLEHSADNGTETWDLRAEGGREITAGIYLYQVRAHGFEYFNRFAVIK